MIDPLNAAFGDIAEIRPVPFGIDPMWYAVERDTTTNPGPKRWLAVTRLTQAKLGSLIDWGAPLFTSQNRELHLFGPMQETIELPKWIRYHGPASPETLCTSWFPKAQGLVTLSRHAEGRPQVMLEAMAAGLPIVASRLSAHEDIVAHGKTGWLCDHAADMSEGIARFEIHAENRRAGAAAREWALRELGTWDDCARRYTNLYLRLLGRNPSV